MRLFDVAADVRAMARQLSQSEVEEIPLNDKRVQIHLDEIENWAIRSRSKLEIQLRRMEKQG